MTRVLIAVTGPEESAIAAAVDARPGLSVARRCADLGEALAAAEAGVGAVVVVSPQAHLHRGVVADFASAGVACVGVAAGPDANDHLTALGIAAVVAMGDQDSLVDAIEDAAIQVPRAHEDVVDVDSAEPSDPGRVLAVWGPTGAPGRTTVAVNLAYELATLAPTIVVDVDTYGGAVAQALGLLDEAPGIAALARASLQGSLSDDDVHRHALQAAPGLRVLSGITRADRWPELSHAALGPVFELLRSHASYVVVDCGFGLASDEELAYDTRAPQRHGAALSALDAADLVLAVGSAEPLGVQRLVHGLVELDAVAPADETDRMVLVNRVRASVAGVRPREAVADALRRYSAVERVWTLPWDAKACDAAALAGAALGERSPRSALRKAMQTLAVDVAARTAADVPAPA